MPSPCIPFLGVYLTDLTFIELGNPDFLKKSHYINFSKRFKVYKLIKECLDYQKMNYDLQVVLPIFQFFVDLDSQTFTSEDLLYGLSLELEPKKQN